jgi:ubiquinone/menaquinone biosynthesis C-methylase UbiE
MTTHNPQTKERLPKAAKPYKGMAMEGIIATWYARVREQDQELAMAVRQVSEALPVGGRILEVAPGPGSLAIELAKLKYQVVGLDISKSFVEMAQTRARQAGAIAEFRHGNASDMPFDADTFDFIVCRAAFKNFSEPVQAIREMHRVLKLGGKALIIDLRRDAPPEDINAAVDSMGLSWINRLLTNWTFKHVLLKNAYTRGEIERFVSQTNFGKCEIRADAIGMEIWLEK